MGPSAAGEGRWSFSRDFAVEVLRSGLGVIWAVNLVFIVDPANMYFGTFAATAQSYGPTSLGGSGLANFVAQNAVVFAWMIAGVTAYLAVAFLLGLTTRLACYIGVLFAAALLWTQIGSTFVIPGGTDVGAHPLYLLIYVVLIAGAAGRGASVDQWIWKGGHPRFPRLSRWLGSPER